jgi:hypothetical protein
MRSAEEVIMSMGRASTCIAVSALITLSAGQATAQSRSGAVLADVGTVVSANPLLILFEWFNLEVEHRAWANGTAGIQGSTFRSHDDRYLSGRGFVRYYPKAAFDKFFLGVRAGVTQFDEEDAEPETLFAAGVEVGLTWMLGSRHRFYVSIGQGVDRLFGSETVPLPTLRLVNIGWAF